MKRAVYIIIPCLFIFSTRAQDTLTLTLEKCIQIALENNLDLLKNEYQVDINSTRLNQSRTSSLPSINAFASQGQNTGKSINPFTNTFLNQKIITGQYGISSNMTLFNGFYNYNVMKQNLFNYRASKFDYEQVKLDLTLNVTSLYYQVLSSEEILNETKVQYEIGQKQVDRLEALNSNHAISPNILYDAKGQFANDKINLINAKNTLEISKLNLLQLLNLENVIFIKVSKVEPNIEIKNETINDVYNSATKSFPSIQSQNNRKEAYRRGLLASWGSIIPSISLYGSIGTNYSDAASIQKYNYISDAMTNDYVIVNNNKENVYTQQFNVTNEKINFEKQFRNNLNTYVGINLQVPIFNSLRQKTQIKISKIYDEQSKKQTTSNLIRLKLSIQKAMVDVNSSREKYEASLDQATFYSQSYKIALTKYEMGAITIVDYAYAKGNNDKAQINLITSKYDYFLKNKALEYYTGKLN